MLRNIAALYTCDRVYDLLLEEGKSLRAADIAVALKEWIDVPPCLLKEWLGADERFVASDKRHDLAVREEGGSLPVEALIRRILKECGHPLSPQALIPVASFAKKRHPEQMLHLVTRILEKREEFFPIGDGRFGLSEWLLHLPSDEEEEILLTNFFEQYAEMRKLLEEFDPSGLESKAGLPAVAREILRGRGCLTGKVLALLAWRVFGKEFNPVEFYKALIQAEGLCSFSDGTWCLSEWVEEARQWTSKKAAEALLRAVEVIPKEVLRAVSEGKIEPLDLSKEEKEALNRLLEQADMLSVMDAVREGLDIGPADEDYLPASVAVYNLFQSDQRLERVGALKFALKETIPYEIRELPQLLLPHPPVFPPDVEESPDVILEDEGLDGDLAQLVHDPELEDIGEEEEVSFLPEQALPSDELTYLVFFHHFTSGVVKVRKLDRRVLLKEPKFINLTLLTPEGERRAWVNNELGLLFLGQDFFRSLGFPPSGGKMRLKPAEALDTFHAEMVGTDERALISADRIEELADLKGRAKSEQLTTFEIIRSIMERHKKGVEFFTVHAEANVVRRVPKRMVASILSGYHCFYQRHSQPNLWTYDERRLAQGFKSAKKKYLRRG